jgi:hypothetical protein
MKRLHLEELEPRLVPSAPAGDAQHLLDLLQASRGTTPGGLLVHSARLDAAAAVHLADMLDGPAHYYGHINPATGETPVGFVRAAGFDYVGSDRTDGGGAVGEALDLGQPTVDRAFAELLASKSHHDLLLGLDNNLAEVGVAVRDTPSGKLVAVVLASGPDDWLVYPPGTDARFVADSYVRFLGRRGEKAGQAFWEGQLQSGMSRRQVEAGFLTSAEYRGLHPTDYVDALYRDVLGRERRADETYWLGRPDAAAGVLASAEAGSR